MHKQPRPLKKKKKEKKIINICAVHAPILSNALTSENTHGDLEAERSAFCRDLQRGESGAQRNLTDWPQWLCYTTDALRVNSVSTHAMFHLSEQFRIASDKTVIRLLTSSSRLVCCILESCAALICCCSKHLEPPQNLLGVRLQRLYVLILTACVVTVSKWIEGPLGDGWVIGKEQSAEEIWWHPESSGQSSLLFICIAVYVGWVPSPQRSVSLNSRVGHVVLKTLLKTLLM